MNENGNGHVSPETLLRAHELIRIGRKAVEKAQEESRVRGIPNVYSINGQIYYELSNGELTREEPEIFKTTIPKAGSS